MRRGEAKGGVEGEREEGRGKVLEESSCNASDLKTIIFKSSCITSTVC